MAGNKIVYGIAGIDRGGQQRLELIDAVYLIVRSHVGQLDVQPILYGDVPVEDGGIHHVPGILRRDLHLHVMVARTVQDADVLAAEIEIRGQRIGRVFTGQLRFGFRFRRSIGSSIRCGLTAACFRRTALSASGKGRERQQCRQYRYKCSSFHNFTLLKQKHLW